MKQLVILAGGRGTRLSSQLGDLPKPMIAIAGKPLLQHQIELAARHGCTDIVLLTGYRSEAIEQFFGDGHTLGVRLRYVREETPKGTAGALIAASTQLAERFALMYGDTMLDVDLTRMWSYHVEQRAEVTLFVHPNNHPYDSDLVEAGADDRVIALHPKPHPPGVWRANLVNAALYVMDKATLADLAFSEALPDIARHAFPEMLRRGVRLFAYRSPEYIRDVGTPDRYARVTDDFLNGIIAARSLSRPGTAVFFDRDGTLTSNHGYVRRAEDIGVVTGAADAVRRVNGSEHLAVLVTNQPVVARGEVTEAELQRIHNRFEGLLAEDHAYLDRIYFCPHHPDKGFAGERADLKMVCACRKPATGMYEAAAKDLALDLKRCWMIGDSSVDVRAAKSLSMRSILLRTGERGADGRFHDRPDYVFHAIGDAVDFVLRGHASVSEHAAPVAARVKPGDWVAIGGLAHSGKSTVTTVLRELLAARGQRAIIVSLDDWLLSESERASTALEDIYDLAGLRAFVETTKRRPVSLKTPRYDRATRTRSDDGEAFELTKDDVIILDGVVALHFPELRDAVNLRVFAHVEETRRRERFVRDYAWRGIDAQRAQALYESRHASEHDLIRASRAAADIIIEDAA